MSRSRKKLPISGITTATSESEWKSQAARKLRRHVKQTLAADPESFDLAGKRWDVADEWDGPKDGKKWFKDWEPRDLRK